MLADVPLRPRDVVFDPERILRALDGHAVRYVLIGGVAPGFTVRRCTPTIST